MVNTEEKKQRIQEELITYRDHHTHTNTEVNIVLPFPLSPSIIKLLRSYSAFDLFVFQWLNQDERIRELEFNGEELRAEVQVKTRQIHDLQENIATLKADGNTLRDQKNTAHNDVGSPNTFRRATSSIL